MNLGEIFKLTNHILDNPNFLKIEEDSEVRESSDKLFNLIEQIPVSNELEKNVGDFVKICKDKLKKY